MKVLKRFCNMEPSERYFLFTDGSYNNKYPSVVGVGAELRNKSGEIVLVYSEKLRLEKLNSQINGTDCEKIALIQALKICRAEGIVSLIVRTDCSGMSNKVKQYIEASQLNLEKKKEMRAEATFINHKLFDSVDLFKDISIEFIPRHFNQNADYYSRATLELSYVGVSQMSEMPSIEKIVEKVETDIQRGQKIEPKEVKVSGPSVKFLHLSKNSLKDTNKKLNKDLMIDIQDDIKSKILKFRVFYLEDDVRNPDEYQLIEVCYNNASKCAIILFVIHNLVGENSSIQLLKSRKPDTKSYNYNYCDNDWMSFDNLSMARNYYKTIIYMSDELFKNFNKARGTGFKQEISAECFQSFYKTIYNRQVDYFVGVTNNQALLYIDEQKIKDSNEKSHRKNLSKENQMSQ